MVGGGTGGRGGNATMEPFFEDGLVFVPPRTASRKCVTRHPICRSSLSALRKEKESKEEFIACTRSEGRRRAPAGMWGSGLGMSDVFAEKAFLYKSAKLLSAPHEDPVIYSYGLLPPQHKSGKGMSLADQIHPVDLVDALLANSLVQVERRRRKEEEEKEENAAGAGRAGKIRRPRRRIPKPWNSTMRVVTDSILWRPDERLV